MKTLELTKKIEEILKNGNIEEAKAEAKLILLSLTELSMDKIVLDIEVEENMLNEDKKCTCDECCDGDNCKSKDEKPACEAEDAVKVNLEVELDEKKLKKAVDAIVDEAFEKAGKAAEASNHTWEDFFKLWEELWVEPSKREEPFKVTCGTVAGPNVKFGTINEVLDDLWRKPAKKVNPKGGHPQEK